MIKINLVREGRAVRGAGPAPAAAQSVSVPGGGTTNINNLLVIGLLVVGALVAAGYWFIKQRTLSDKQETVRVRTAEAAKLESVIREVEAYQRQKDSLQKRIDLINQLKQNQKGPVRIMDRISQDLPDLVWLDRMNVNNGQITLNGRGLNPNAIANFVENIKNDPFFEEPQVGSVTQASVVPLVYAFDMDFSFTYQAKTPGAAPGTTTGATTTTGTATATTGAATKAR
ncbi:MAG: PilN domain-containing protein [Thermoanaerobaculia bacterium]